MPSYVHLHNQLFWKGKEVKHKLILKEKETWTENSLFYTPSLRPAPPSWSQRRRHRQSCPSLFYLSNLFFLSSPSCLSCLLSSPSTWHSAGPPSLHIGIWLWMTQLFWLVLVGNRSVSQILSNWERTGTEVGDKITAGLVKLWRIGKMFSAS